MWKSIAAAIAVLSIGLGAGAYYAHLHPFTSGQDPVRAAPGAPVPSCSPVDHPAVGKSCPACQEAGVDEPACPACREATGPGIQDAGARSADDTAPSAGRAAPEK